MKRFLPAPRLMPALSKYIQDFIPQLERILDGIENKIPEKGPTAQQIREELLNDPDFKDAIYRYIKNREGRENA